MSATMTQEDFRANAEGISLLGVIVCWSAGENQHTHAEVVQALKDAALDETIARELLPRHAFARACKSLADQRVIDLLRDDGSKLYFQFTHRRLTNDEWEYAKETTLVLEKSTGKVECGIISLQDLAQAELDRCLHARTAGDITRIVQRLFDRNADLFPIREQGGAYFVPAEHMDYAQLVKLFLEKLGGYLRIWPIPVGTKDGNQCAADAVATGLAAIIREHEEAVEEFHADTRTETLERAGLKIKETRVKVEAYAHYLNERRQELLEAVDAANEKLRLKANAINGVTDDAASLLAS